MRKSFKYRIYPGPGQRRKLESTLESCRWLYNHLLGARKDTYEGTGYSLNHYEQTAILPSLKIVQPHLNCVYSQVLQNVAVRVDLGMKAFFRRVKAKETPGFPRFRGKGQYSSFTYPQSGFEIVGEKIRLSKIGLIKAVIHRPLEGRSKTCTVFKSSTGKWYAAFSCDWESIKRPENNKQIGIDLGLNTFATLSSGEKIETPKFFRVEEKSLAKAQKAAAKTEKASKERKKRRKITARIYERISWRRSNFIHQESRKIVNNYGFIFIESLSVNRMLHSRLLAKSILDAAWSGFTSLMSVKAEWAGRIFKAVNPAYTSQDCHKCGHRQKISLDIRTYRCSCCGLVMCRDLNAALNILRLGQQSQRLT